MKDQTYNEKEVLLVRPFMYPKRITTSAEYKDLAEVIGGDIEITFPFDDPVAIVYNEAGKLTQSMPCRALRTPTGNIYNVICGPFLIVGLHGSELCSLSAELMEKYQKLFHQPEVFVNAGGTILAIPVTAKTDGWHVI